jgi:hypothetical protein
LPPLQKKKLKNPFLGFLNKIKLGSNSLINLLNGKLKMGGKAFKKFVSKKVSSVKKASAADIGKYAGRAVLNTAKGAGQLASGDYRGAAKTVIGQKNMTQGATALLGKKAVKGINKADRIVGRAQGAMEKAQSGDFKGAATQAAGKKMMGKVEKAMSGGGGSNAQLNHHIARGAHHASQANAIVQGVHAGLKSSGAMM